MNDNNIPTPWYIHLLALVCGLIGGACIGLVIYMLAQLFL